MTTGFTQRFRGKTLGEAGSQIRFGKSGTAFGLSGQVYNYLAVTGTGNGNDTTEDTLQSYSLPANALDVVGRGLIIQAFGNLATNAHSKTVKLYFGSSIVLSTAAQTGSNVPWFLELQIWKQASNVQIGFGQPIVSTTHGGVVLYTAGSEADTAAITIKVTGQTGTAAANDVVLNGLSIFAMD